MGLDMYLNKRIYIGAEYEHRKITGKIQLKENGKPIDIKLERVSYIEERVGYWRKANQIHNWFVKNVQNGVDNCGDYDVSEEQLTELLAICKEIKEKCTLTPGKVANGYTITASGNKKPTLVDGKLMENSHLAAKLLPSASGFFFGSTDYDEYYLQDIENTIEIIETLFSEKGESKYFNGDIQYSSSW